APFVAGLAARLAAAALLAAGFAMRFSAAGRFFSGALACIDVLHQRLRLGEGAGLGEPDRLGELLLDGPVDAPANGRLQHGAGLLDLVALDPGLQLQLLAIADVIIV